MPICMIKTNMKDVLHCGKCWIPLHQRTQKNKNSNFVKKKYETCVNSDKYKICRDAFLKLLKCSKKKFDNVYKRWKQGIQEENHKHGNSGEKEISQSKVSCKLFLEEFVKTCEPDPADKNIKYLPAWMDARVCINFHYEF
jgi:hypothetical protein